ncbi:YdcF family protein [Marinilongibacter aquaticus]|uniref:YdcF family protein n=1 Tax=Marinilongibacter aquaticus TaxID=2975157 RepID=UPI0021BD091B|nr:YdcF family protein [Marinilongibacter aquaticus]UBM60672.1 YdcF family protein [Marinilongibacter aquaticus]
MFYIISKLFSFLILPVGWVLMLLGYALLSKNAKRAKLATVSAVLVLWLTASPFFVNFFLKRWEMPEKDIRTLPHFTYGVLLTGGMVNESVRYPQNINLDRSGDRLWQTLRLYKQGKIDSVIISGGDVTILYDKQWSEGQFAKEFLIENGVPAEKIYHENKSRNTHENAEFTANYLASRGQQGKMLLITSAYHMRRALACFEKQELSVVDFSSNFLTYQGTNDIVDFLPTAKSFYSTRLLSKEIWGFLIYSVVGYI